MGHDGTPLGTAPRPAVREVSFALNEAEQALLVVIQALSQALEASTPQHALVGRNLLRALRSSPAAIDSAAHSWWDDLVNITIAPLESSHVLGPAHARY